MSGRSFQLVNTPQPAKERQFYSDWQGSTRWLTNPAGRESVYSCDAYGRALERPQQPETTAQYAGAHGYQRESGPSELGLDYLYQRYYDPQVGRFLSRDPIGYAGGLNLFGYCSGNPIASVDPLGLWEDDELGHGDSARAAYGSLLSKGTRDLLAEPRFKPGSKERVG